MKLSFFKIMSTLALTVLLLIIYLPYTYGETTDNSCFSTQWPHELSKLSPDPTVRYGKLPNGFRYVLKHNETPRDRVALYLNVQVGSMYEKDNERGFAHYLEHMLFNGTTHFPPGKLVKYFQEIGMNFGADTNAYTTFENTVYTLVLPRSDIEEIKKGFLVIQDYAEGALLLPEEVERERGVILAEKRTRDSVEYRTHVATNKNALAGTLLAERQPIGIDKTLKAVNSDALKSFYDKWYRPDNMILFIVGDIDVQAVEELLQKTFNHLIPRSEKPQCPDVGRLLKTGLRSFYYYEPESGDTQVSIESYWQQLPQNDSYELQVENLRDYIATLILQKRLERIAEKEVGGLSAPRVYSGDFINIFRYSVVTASTTKGKWQDVLSLLDITLRQAIQNGVTPQELELAKKEVQAYLIRQVRMDKSRKSTQLIREMSYSIHKNRVFQSPEQEQRLFNSAVSHFTAEDIQKSIVKLFNRSDKLIEVTGNAELGNKGAEQQILSLYNKVEKQQLHKYAEEKILQFPYLYPLQKTVKPFSNKKLDDIDVHRYTYENKNILNFKKTNFKKNQVSVQIRFGPGERGEPAPGIAMLAEEIIDESGTGALTRSQLEDVLAGSSVSHNFRIDTSQFSLSGTALTKDVKILFDTLYSCLRDPGFRQEVYQNTMTNVEQMYRSMESDVGGAEALYVKPFMAGGNTLFGMVPLKSLETINFSQIKDWIFPIFANAKLEVSVIGDVDEKVIVDLAGKYFGSLNPGKKVIYSKETVVFPQGQKRKFFIESKLDKTLLAIAWQTEGFNDIENIRRLNMLADVFEERIRLAVREKLGATYSPVVYHTASRSIPEYGMLYVRIITGADQVGKVEKVVRKISNGLATSGVSEEELLRVKKPTLTSLKDKIRTNSYWLHAVLAGSTVYPEQLQWPTTLIEDYESITADELSLLAKKYLDPARAASAIVLPEDMKK